MKAIFATSDNKRLEIRETSKPQIQENEVLVKVEYVGVNRADVMQKHGHYPPPKGVTEIIGLEFSGIIDELGSGVKIWKLGDKVCGIVAGGAYAEYVRIHADHLIKVPDNISMEEAAGLSEAFITAFQALIHIGNIKNSDLILIHAGASGVGAAAIQMAKNEGAKVICTASASKHDFCQKLGADDCIDYKSVSFDHYFEQNFPEGADMVLDFVGADYFQKNMNVLGMDGKMVMLGFLGGIKVENLNIAPIIMKRLKIMGSTLRARSNDYKTELILAFKSKYMESSGKFPFILNIDKVFSFAEANEAHEYMEQNKNKGKIVLSLRL